VFVVKGGFQGGAEGAVPPLILEKFLLKFWLVDKIITFFVIVYLYFIDFPHASIRVFAKTVPTPSIFLNFLDPPLVVSDLPALKGPSPRGLCSQYLSGSDKPPRCVWCRDCREGGAGGL
jgi:hypothetical protein